MGTKSKNLGGLNVYTYSLIYLIIKTKCSATVSTAFFFRKYADKYDYCVKIKISILTAKIQSLTFMLSDKNTISNGCVCLGGNTF